jgi:hypothetical protein
VILNSAVKLKERTLSMHRRAALSLAGVAAVSVAAPTMAKEDVKANKTTTQIYINTIWNNGDMSALDAIVSPKFTPSKADDAPGIEGLKQRLSQMLQFNGFTVNNIKYGLHDLAGDGAFVFGRGSVTGTSSAGKKIDASFFVELKFSGGLIVTEWSAFDQSAMLGL